MPDARRVLYHLDTDLLRDLALRVGVEADGGRRALLAALGGRGEDTLELLARSQSRTWLVEFIGPRDLRRMMRRLEAEGRGPEAWRGWRGERRLREYVARLPIREICRLYLGDPGEGSGEGRPAGFAAVVGLDCAKEVVRRRLILPLREPDLARQHGVEPGGGLLLHGPPGAGKTWFARAVAAECRLPIHEMRIGETLSKWHGETEGRIAGFFDRARRRAPSVAFIDEIDGIAPARGGDLVEYKVSEVDALLQEIDAAQNRGVLIIAATNHPWLVDDGLLRSGRLGTHVFLGLPDALARRRIIAIHLDGLPDADLAASALAVGTEGWTPADLAERARAYREERFVRAADQCPEADDPAAVAASLPPPRPSSALAWFAAARAAVACDPDLALRFPGLPGGDAIDLCPGRN